MEVVDHRIENFQSISMKMMPMLHTNSWRWSEKIWGTIFLIICLFKEIGETKYSLLGWSDGGISSIILAGKRAESVENLIIWGSNAYVTKEELQIYDSK